MLSLLGTAFLTANDTPDDVGVYSLNNNSTPHDDPMTKPTPITNGSNLDERIMLDEQTGHTNKSPEQLILESERRLAAMTPSPRLDSSNLPKEICWVEVPEKVIVALRNIIAGNDLPIDDLTRDWLEAEVADHNGVPAEHIAADGCIISKGKSWRYLPESARANTGFSFYPLEK